MPETKWLRVKGIYFMGQRPPVSDPAVLLDFFYKSFEWEDARRALDCGIFPVGTIVQGERHGSPGPLSIVLPEPLGGQRVEIMRKIIKI